MRARSLMAVGAVLPLLLLTGCGSSSKGGSSNTVADNSADSKVLVVLADDLKLQTVDNIVPVVRTKVASPALEQALDKVSSALSVSALIGLNKSVDIDRQTSVAAAEAFVKANSLDSGVSGGSGKIRVGGANFSESTTLANVYADALKGAGFDASVVPVTSREVYEPALEKGNGLDVFPEYVGTLTEFLNTTINGANAAPKASSDLTATVAALKALATPRGLTIYTPAAADDKNAFAVTKKFAEDNHLTKLSDLKGVKDLTLGGPPECPKRPFCELGLEKTYGITFAGFKSLDSGGPLTKKALTDGTIQVGLVFSSDGSLSSL